MTIDPIDKMPADCWGSIFLYLGDAETLARLRRVSRLFKNVVDGTALEISWKQFFKLRFAYLDPMRGGRAQFKWRELYFEFMSKERTVIACARFPTGSAFSGEMLS